MTVTSAAKGKQSAMSVHPGEIDALKKSLQGKLLRQGDKGYDEARTIWNAMIDRKPAIIIQPAGAADVQKAVNFAREHNLLVAIKGGGHNIAGNAVCDDGLMIDFSQMRAVKVDPAAKIAHVEAGALLSDVDHATQAHGLAVPLGINSTTGVAGLTLGGGFGWLTRQHGMSIDNLRAMDVITADGNLVTCTASQHGDLFWALCGGGGNFGVVTRFEFNLHPVGPTITAGLVVYPLSEAAGALKQYREYVKTLPFESNVWVVLRKAPPLPFLPVEAHGTDILAFPVFFNGRKQDGMKQLDPVRHFGKAIGEFIDEMPYEDWQKMFDGLLGPGARNYWKSHNFGELSDKFIDTVINATKALPSVESDLFLGFIQGVANKMPRSSAAYPHRDCGWAMNVHGRWMTPQQDEKGIKWARDVYRDTAEFALRGVYVNFLTAEEKDRIREAYGEGWDRLVAAKQKYDPKNLFCMNQNIDPKG